MPGLPAHDGIDAMGGELLADPVAEGRQLISQAAQQGLVMRALGGVAVFLQSGGGRPRLVRSVKDIDLAVAKGNGKAAFTCSTRSCWWDTYSDCREGPMKRTGRANTKVMISSTMMVPALSSWLLSGALPVDQFIPCLWLGGLTMRLANKKNGTDNGNAAQFWHTYPLLTCSAGSSSVLPVRAFPLLHILGVSML